MQCDTGYTYFEFTNFYEAPITINDKRWATAENYFQGQKFIGSPFEEAVRQCSTAREALNLPRLPEVKQWQRKDWFEANVDVMRVGLYAKFTQHKYLLSDIPTFNFILECFYLTCIVL